VHDIVAGEFTLLLQNFVLLDEQIAAKGLTLIFVNQLLHLLVAQLQQLDVRLAPEVQV